MTGNFDVQIVVEERISDEELTDKFEQYMNLKFQDIRICKNCNYFGVEGWSDMCPRCDENYDFVELSEINQVGLI